MARPQSVEENAVLREFVKAALPAVIQISMMPQCMNGTCHNGHDCGGEYLRVVERTYCIAEDLLEEFQMRMHARSYSHIPEEKDAPVVSRGEAHVPRRKTRPARRR